MDGLIWELLEQVFTAETLMTPRAELRTWERGNGLSSVINEARQQHFDLIPVTEGGRIVGVLRAETTEPEPVTHQWLVSRDTGIPDLLTLFAESERPGFLVFHRQEVIGLVTPADLNKLPARVYVYNLIGELELALANWIRRHFADDPNELIKLLSEERRKELKDEQGELIRGNADIEIVQLLYLSDLVNIVVKRESLRAGLGFPSRKQAEKALNGLVNLRNQTMHLVRPLVASIPEDLVKMHQRLQRASDILQRLSA